MWKANDEWKLKGLTPPKSKESKSAKKSAKKSKLAFSKKPGNPLDEFKKSHNEKDINIKILEKLFSLNELSITEILQNLLNHDSAVGELETEVAKFNALEGNS